MNQPRHVKRQVPAWLWGLLIAIVVFGTVIVVARILGYGDDPAIGAFGVIFGG